ncbi:MAG: hypothetical protein AAGA48_32840 [Myxococcota bacterium]
MRSLFALLVKEMEHHGPALLAGGALALTTLTMFWFASLQRAVPTLMTSGSGFVYYFLPLYVFYVVNRLVVQDRQGGTHAFLAALPLSPVLRFFVQFTVGAVAVSTLVVGALGLTSLLAGMREGLPGGWLGQLLWQCELYALAWLAMDFGIAHLGRIRIVTWILFLSVLIVFDENVLDVFSEVLWHGVLSDPIDQTRTSPPFHRIPQALAWLGFGLALGLGLVTYRGGVLTERLFGQGSSRGFGVQILLILIVPTLLEVVVESATQGTDDAWSTLARKPVPSVDLRVAGAKNSALWAVGRDAATDLQTLQDKLDGPPFSTVVLVAGPAQDFEEVRVAPGSANDRSLVLVVDTDANHGDLVRHVVYYTLLEQADWMAGWNTHTDWLLRGTPGWLRPDPVLNRRASAGSAALEFVPDWLLMELVVGEDVAEGVAWAMVDALPDETVIALLQHVLSHRTSRANLPAARQLQTAVADDWVKRVGGVDLASTWRRALTLQAPDATVWDPEAYALVVLKDGDALRAMWGERPPDGTRLRWRQLDAMSAHPSPGDDVQFLEVDLDAGLVALPLGPGAKVAVDLVWPDATLRGLRTTGWRARW